VLSTIPDSVVSRPQDDDTVTQQRWKGAVVETSQEWPEIGAVISANSSGFETARIYDDGFNTIIDEADISNLSAGDTFFFSNANLQANTTYRFVMNASERFEQGFLRATNFVYTSSDGNLSITAGANRGSDISDFLWNYLKIGNV
jgi:hypothetical protein